MSSYYKKIEYVTMGAYGSTDKKTLYVQYHNGSDTVTVYDEGGKCVLCWDEWGSGNEIDMGQAISIIATDFNNDRLIDMTPEEIKLINK